MPIERKCTKCGSLFFTPAKDPSKWTCEHCGTVVTGFELDKDGKALCMWCGVVASPLTPNGNECEDCYMLREAVTRKRDIVKKLLLIMDYEETYKQLEAPGSPYDTTKLIKSIPSTSFSAASIEDVG